MREDRGRAIERMTSTQDAGAAEAFARRIRVSVGAIVVALLLKVLLALLGAVYLADVARTAVDEQADGLYRAQALQLQAMRMTGVDDGPGPARMSNAAASRARLDFERAVRSLDAAGTPMDERRLLADVLRLESERAEAIARMRQAGSPAAARSVYAEDIAPLGAQMQGRLEAYVQLRQQRFAQARASVARAARLVVTTLAVLAGLGVLAGTAVWLITRRALARIKRDEARLRTLITTRDDFIAAVAHELRTPLSVLSLNVDLLNRRTTALPGQPVEVPAPALAMLERNVAVVVSLADRLLDVSLIDSGRLKLQPDDVDLAALAREAADRAAPSLAGKPCTISVHAPTPVEGRWDPVRIAQVLDNLLLNAVRHACDGPIQVEVAQQHGIARFSIRDRGSGLSAPEQARIFERFERLGPTADGSGMGLGLAITRDIVEAHGGTIRVDSQPGAGACFTVELPREAAPE